MFEEDNNYENVFNLYGNMFGGVKTQKQTNNNNTDTDPKPNPTTPNKESQTVSPNSFKAVQNIQITKRNNTKPVESVENSQPTPSIPTTSETQPKKLNIKRKINPTPTVPVESLPPITQDTSKKSKKIDVVKRTDPQPTLSTSITPIENSQPTTLETSEKSKKPLVPLVIISKQSRIEKVTEEERNRFMEIIKPLNSLTEFYYLIKKEKSIGDLLAVPDISN